MTGEGARPHQNSYRVSNPNNQDFFADGEGWDVVVFQDRADSITDWIRGSGGKLEASLQAMDTFAEWVRIAAGKMRRRPSVIFLNRPLISYHEFMAGGFDPKLLR
jgi:hypothetical protein